jgi:hypothetical protein
MADDDRPLPGRPEGTEAVHIRTFLIADVRGYTLFTQERGDEAATKLAARFADVAREVVEEHGGSVIELRGDEALAAFNSARQAILAAAHAQDRFLEETLADPSFRFPSVSDWMPERRCPWRRATEEAPSTWPLVCAAGRDPGRSWRARGSSTSPGRWRAFGTWTGGTFTSRAWLSRFASSE